MDKQTILDIVDTFVVSIGMQKSLGFTITEEPDRLTINPFNKNLPKGIDLDLYTFNVMWDTASVNIFENDGTLHTRITFRHWKVINTPL